MDKVKLDYLVLVVLYNKAVQDSETMQSLLRLKDQLGNIKLLVWDNSPEPFIQKEELTLLQNTFISFEYVSTPENLTLSAIYNKVIGRDEINNFNYLLLLDHDSDLPGTFFKALATAITDKPDVNLFLPIVYSGGEIVSPANLYYFKGIRWKQKIAGPVKTKWKAAINSGMVISTSYLRSTFKGYDERLKFYGTDTYFMLEYAKHNKYFCVFDAIIQHKLNYFEQEELEVKLRRFKEIKKATSLLNEKSMVASTFTGVYLCMFSVLQAIRFKSLRFLYDSK